MPINGPSIICVGETALISDGSLKGNSKLREVRHPASGEREKFIAQSRGRSQRQWESSRAQGILLLRSVQSDH